MVENYCQNKYLIFSLPYQNNTRKFNYYCLNRLFYDSKGVLGSPIFLKWVIDPYISESLN